MGAPRPLPADVSKAVVDQPGHEVIDDAVVRLAPFVTRGHELQVPQEGKLMAHGGHREPESVGEIADAELVVSKSVHQPEAEGVREREEDLDGLGRGFLRRKSCTHLLDSLRVDDVGKGY